MRLLQQNSHQLNSPISVSNVNLLNLLQNVWYAGYSKSVLDGDGSQEYCVGMFVLVIIPTNH